MSLNVETIGIELSEARATDGSTRGTLSTMVHADAFDVGVTKRSCSLLFLNPPYDHEVTTDSNEFQKKKRLEETFLRTYLSVLQPDGLLIYIVPRHIIAKETVARYISNNINLLSCTKIAEAEYEQFQQVILIGTKRAKMRKNDKLYGELILRGLGTKPMLTLDALALHFEDPEIEFGAVVPRRAVAAENFKIKQHHIPPAAVIKFVTESSAAYSSHRWLDLLPDFSTAKFQPVVPLRTGHIGSLISSGQMGTVQLDNLIAKGSAVKRLNTYNDDNKRCHRDAPQAKYEREHFETTVTTLDNDGTITEIATVHEMEHFLRQHAPTIATIIDDRYAPLYTKPEQKMWHKLDGLMHAKKLPGRAETGMLSTQKHIALAAAKCLKRLGWVDAICEMGFGKSVVSLATVHLLDLFPAIVHCPGHITEKWAQEVRDTFGEAVEPYIINSISDLQKMQSDIEADPGLKAVAILSKEKAKLGSGWTNEPLYRWAKIVDEVTLDEIDPSTKERKIEKQVRYVKAVACPKCGVIHRNKKTGTPVLVPPTKRTFCKAKVRKFKGQAENAAQGETKRVECGEPLYQFGAKYHRWPIAHYIRKKMDGFFKCHVADEVHVFKGKSTDQAMAYHSLIMACQFTINLTGTLFGGKASDLFWMRYRIDPEVRKEYDFNSEMRWARKHGRLEYTIIRESAEEQGAWNGKTRTLSQAKEIPGISPLVYARLLKSTIFAKVEDLGIQLPDYQEEIIPIPMATN